MHQLDAVRAIESLRKGVPPDGLVRHFTVGRASEIETLTATLEHQPATALLLQANYGSGKSHLLRLLREEALNRGFVVSTVALDAKSAVRFNRMDQMLGAIARGIEVPGVSSTRGVRALFDRVAAHIETPGKSHFWQRLSNGGKWDFSDAIESSALFIALRAWIKGDQTVEAIVEDWLTQPWQYRTQRKRLYMQFVHRLEGSFREPRSERQFYINDVFSLHGQGYDQCWAILRDLHRLAIESGLKGLVILFDEFEDIITNLNNVAWQEDAFWNLFQFYGATAFTGPTFFAVTPEFANKCKQLLMRKGRWAFDYSRFEAIPHFQMSPLSASELQALAPRIVECHSAAYGWTPQPATLQPLSGAVARSASLPMQDRVRHTIKATVQFLDDLLQDRQ